MSMNKGKNRMDKSTRVKHKSRGKSPKTGTKTNKSGRGHRGNYDASSGEARNSMKRTGNHRRAGTVPNQ